MLRLWQASSSKMKRIMTIILMFFISIAVTVGGTLTPLSDEDAETLGEGLSETQKGVNDMTDVQKVSFIFGNNFMICLAGFVPFVGPFFEFYVLYSTGVVIAGYTSYQNYPASPTILFLTLFIFPFTWLEFLSYSVAIVGSIWLASRIIRREGRREIKNTCILLSICAVLLLLAAIIEAAIIAMT